MKRIILPLLFVGAVVVLIGVYTLTGDLSGLTSVGGPGR